MNNAAGRESESPKRVSYRSVALPAEHGSWSLVSEPILLGLLVAPSWAGAILAVGAFALFLFNRPFKIYWADWRKGRWYERTKLARRVALLYGLCAATGFIVAFALVGWPSFVPLALALPLLAIFVVFDRRPGRTWQAELAAPVAFAAIAAAIALAGGVVWLPALALWGFMIARAVPAIIFIRARLRLDRGKEAGPGDNIAAAVSAHLAALVGILLLVWPGWLPWTAVIAGVLLLARCAWGLSPWRRRSSVKALGLQETAFGVVAVILVAAG